MNPSRLCSLLVGASLLAFATGCGRTSKSVALDLPPDAAEKKSEPASGERFAFPKDDGGTLLATFLPPETVAQSRPLSRSEPRNLAGLPALDRPEIRLPLEVANGALPEVALIKEDPKKKLKPRMVPDDPPLVHLVYDLGAPGRDDLPASPLTRLPSVDVNQPLALPVLQQPLADRAPLDDPSAAYSLENVLATPAPERASPAPVWFLNLPDPFEHREVVRLRVLPPEDSALPH